MLSNYLRILAVDDEKDILGIYQKVLCPKKVLQDSESDKKHNKPRILREKIPDSSFYNFELTLCQKSCEVIEAVKKSLDENKPFAAAFIDIRLSSGPDGVETAKRIRLLDPYINIMMVTGHYDVNPQAIASEVPPADKLFYIQKPFHPQEIRQFALALGEKWKAERQLRKIRSEQETVIKKKTAELARSNKELQVEIKERKRTEKTLRQSEKELKIRNRIAEIFLTIPDEEMYAEALRVVLDALESKYGTFGYFDSERDGAFVCTSMTRDICGKCQVHDKEAIFRRGTWKGIWGQAVKKKKIFYDNKGPFSVPQGYIHIKNTMAVPIIYHDKVISAIHIANKTTDYNEKDRALLEAIVDYIAPVLHARLERDKQNEKRKRVEETLRTIDKDTAGVTGKEFLRCLVKQLATVFGFRYAFVGKVVLPGRDRIKTLTVWADGDYAENIEYDLDGTPCANVVGQEFCLYPKNVQQQFPDDHLLVEMEVESYMGTPLIDSSGNVVGLLTTMHDKPMDDLSFFEPIMKIIATRTIAEIERNQAEEKLQNALIEVEKLKNHLEAENVYLQDEIKTEHNFEEIICQDRMFKEVLDKVAQVAPTDSTVLILGETGTGKELLARAIHHISNRKDRPLVKVDCAALPANLIESELFGHEKGAFTGAGTRRTGRFELANGGTVFLDEIGELPLELQMKLLRIIQDGEFERLGSSYTVKVDVRIIAATNRNLERAVEAGNFRQDLYYRLNVFPITTLPLRRRTDDIPLLVNYFTSKYSAKIGKKIESIPQNMMDSLQHYHWPGNIRELENIIERAVVLAKGSNLKLNGLLDQTSPIEQRVISMTLRENERAFIIKTLEQTNWVIQGPNGAAARLGLNPGTLRSRMKKLGIKRQA